ncbi:lytic transglycosylase domain-containing protein [Paenarthrobacter sp. NEAU-H11]|uniref:aggregation-promoting factor C-terminal-like domain-containing protein n=1 Tax=Paenarthrobacter sp. NEAU-H11 TaxID=3423924 RepID=UPI003D33E883
MSRSVLNARHRLPGILLAAALAGSVWLTPAGAAEGVPPGGYPSWEDVERAKLTEAGTEKEIGMIAGLLDGLQAQSEALGNAAVASAAESAAADAALAASTARVESLAEQAGTAKAELIRHRKDIGALAAQSYKTGGTNMGFFVALDAIGNNNVHGLNVVHLVGGKTAGLVDKAAAAGKVTASLADQEKAARAERERLSGEAAEKLAAARSAQEAMARQLTEEQQRNRELTEQLASLKGTTAAVEGEFRRGQAALAAYEAAQEAKRAAAGEEARRRAAAAAAAAKAQPSAAPAPVRPAPADPAPENPPAGNPAPADPAPPVPAPAPAAPPSPPAVVIPSAPAGAVNDPAGAKSYASGRLGAYGWGSDQFLCLARLWTKESNWLTTATNPYSGAYGIPQALPPGKYSSAGSDWLTNYRTQIEWGLGYIRERYGSPCSAWNHSVARNWY